MSPIITADEWWKNHKRVQVLDGPQMAYYDSDPDQERSSKTVVFLHGNPTSSYLWRNIIPHVEPLARCLAPDLIGLGRSSKLPNPNAQSYRFIDEYMYVSDWFDKVKLPEKVTIVCHDWGSAIGINWCSQHESRVESLVHMESIACTMPGGLKTFEKDLPEVTVLMKKLRSPEGETLILEHNLFVENILPNGIIRELDEKEMEAYREPFRQPGEDRRPTLTLPRDIPMEGDGPDDVIVIADKYHEWLKASTLVPKLFIDTEGGWLSLVVREMCKGFANHKVVGPIKGRHFVQEDAPDEIGTFIRDFLTEIYKQ